jgi:hypothetical protein
MGIAAPLYWDGFDLTETVRICAAPGCGKDLKRRPNESRAKFAKRRYCGNPCANRARNEARRQRFAAELEPRQCACCPAILVIRPGERVGDFRRRNICGDPACRSARAQKSAQARWNGRRAAQARRLAPPLATAMPIPAGMTTEQAIALFIAERGVTRCPTAAVLPTTARMAMTDKTEIAAYNEAKNETAAKRMASRKWGWPG